MVLDPVKTRIRSNLHCMMFVPVHCMCAAGPSGVIIHTVTDTYVTLKVNVTVHGNLPIVTYRFRFEDTVNKPQVYTFSSQKSIYVRIKLTADTHYGVSARIKNKYAWSWLSSRTYIRTLPSGKCFSTEQNLCLKTLHVAPDSKYYFDIF